MTPTLRGRWQTRLILLGTLGVLITLYWMWRWQFFTLAPRDLRFWKLLLLLGYVALLGLGWDVVYQYLQGYRWDRDWPLIFHFACGILEGLVVYGLFRLGVLPGVEHEAGDTARFAWQYGTVWLVTYWGPFSYLRVVTPRWRFNGGEFFPR